MAVKSTKFDRPTSFCNFLIIIYSHFGTKTRCLSNRRETAATLVVSTCTPAVAGWGIMPRPLPRPPPTTNNEEQRQPIPTRCATNRRA